MTKNANSSLNYDEDGGSYYITIQETIGMIQVFGSNMKRMFPATDMKRVTGTTIA